MFCKKRTDAAYCYAKARAAQERAANAGNIGAQRFFREIERRWLRRASAYEEIDRLTAVVTQLNALPKLPLCPACNALMQPNGVGCRRGSMEYHYQCAACAAEKIVIEIDT